MVEPPLAETLAVFAAVFAATYALPTAVDAAKAVSYALLTAEAEATLVVLVHAVEVTILPVVKIVLCPAPSASADACQTALA